MKHKSFCFNKKQIFADLNKTETEKKTETEILIAERNIRAESN